MKVLATVLVCGVSIAALGTSSAEAQTTESRLQQVTYMHISPGQTSTFEQRYQARNRRMADGNVTFRTNVSVLEGQPTVYRAVTPNLDNMGSLDARRAQMAAVAPAIDGNVRTNEIRGIIDHFESEMRVTRPDLSYIPETRRIPSAEVRFVRDIDVYLKAGTQAEAIAIFKQMTALFRRHNMQSPVFVTLGVMGSGPNLRFSTGARDAADFYTENERVLEQMGDEYQALAGQMIPLTRQVEYVHRTLRRDLGYIPDCRPSQ